MDMKLNLKTLLVFKILILVSHVCFGADLLSKFHQSDYHLRNIRIEVVNLNPKYMHFFRAIGYKYNRTITAFNCTFSTKLNLEDKTEFIVQAYKRASNEYRLFPLRFQANLCKAVATNVLGLKNIVNYGNTTICFWKKDTWYYANGFLFDESHLPPFIPTGEYKDNIEIIHQNNKLFAIDLYLEIYRPEVKN